VTVTDRDLFDINGDGLPDLVQSCDWSQHNPGPWDVYLNQGSGFIPNARPWSSPVPWIAADRECHNDTKDRCAISSIRDIDGDGIVDIIEKKVDGDFEFTGSLRVHHNAIGAWRATGPSEPVVPNLFSGKVDLLEEVENGVGGITKIEYRPSSQWDHANAEGVPQMPMVLWNASSFVRESGMNGTVPGASMLATQIEYANGRFEPASREFRGFGTVFTVDGAGVQRTSVFGKCSP